MIRNYFTLIGILIIAFANAQPPAAIGRLYNVLSYDYNYYLTFSPIVKVSAAPYFDKIYKEPRTKFSVLSKSKIDPIRGEINRLYPEEKDYINYKLYYNYNNQTIIGEEPKKYDTIKIGMFIPDTLAYYGFANDSSFFKYDDRFMALASFVGFSQKREKFADSLRKIAMAEPFINCTKITNSKGQQAYLYIAMQNISPIYKPFLGDHNYAFYNDTFVNSYNPIVYLPTTSWSSDYTREVQVMDYDLPEGTYFFNWWDNADSMYYYIAQLKKADVIEFKNLSSYTRDDYRMLGLDTIKENTSYEFRKLFYKYRRSIHKKIVALGYGSMYEINGIECLGKFNIRQLALASHKISDTPITPQQLRSYMADTTLARPPEVQKMLEVFEN